MDLQIIPSILQGKITPPSSKSLTHRWLITAWLSQREVLIDNVLFSKDIEATLEVIKKLGGRWRKEENRVYFSPCPIVLKEDQINCFESGTTLRFFIPLALLQSEKVTFHGEKRLALRPLSEYYAIFDTYGIEYKKLNVDQELPLEIQGKLSSGEYYLRADISSQFISGLLLALPLVAGESRIHLTTSVESKGYIDLTLEVLKTCGVNIEKCDHGFIVVGKQEIKPPKEVIIESDYSQAAFWLVAGAIASKEFLEILELSSSSHQGDAVILSFLENAGVKILKKNKSCQVFKSNSLSVEFDIAQCPDLGPILCVLLALSKGKGRLLNVQRLEMKESNRALAMVTELRKLGVSIEYEQEYIEIEGCQELKGNVTLSCWDDHRIAMALAIAAQRCNGPVTLLGAECVNKSYPHFWSDLKMLGGSYETLSVGR